MFSVKKSFHFAQIRFLIVLLGIVFTACHNDTQILEIEPSFDSDSLVSHLSHQQGIQLSYPKDWYLHDGEMFISIVPNEEDLPWNRGGAIWPNIFLFTLKAHHRPLTTQSATAFARQQVLIALSNDDYGPTTVIQPATTVNVSGRDGAIFKTERAGIIDYSVVVKITKYRVALVSGSAKPEDISEIEDIVNTIAYSIEVLDD